MLPYAPAHGTVAKSRATVAHGAALAYSTPSYLCCHKNRHRDTVVTNMVSTVVLLIPGTGQRSREKAQPNRVAQPSGSGITISTMFREIDLYQM